MNGYHIRPSGNFLYDNATGDVVGYRDPDGSDKFFATLGESNEFLADQLFRGNVVVLKTAGKGIQCDPADPTFTWRDLEGPIVAPATGAQRPSLTPYVGNVEEYAFSAGDHYSPLKFHMPHDWLPGSDLFIHTHWSHNGTNISGSLVLDYFFTYAKGHSQAAFHAQKNITHTIGSLSIANTPAIQHRIDEVQLSTAGGSASLIDTDILEPDGMILMHFDVPTIPSITGGAGEPFIHYVDIHYLSTNIGTKQKAPNFYT